MAIGPVGEWSPGIHCGYSRVSAPAATGIVSCTRKMPCTVSLASTCSAIVPGYGVSCGAGTWAAPGTYCAFTAAAARAIDTAATRRTSVRREPAGNPAKEATDMTNSRGGPNNLRNVSTTARARDQRGCLARDVIDGGAITPRASARWRRDRVPRPWRDTAPRRRCAAVVPAIARLSARRLATPTLIVTCGATSERGARSTAHALPRACVARRRPPHRRRNR